VVGHSIRSASGGNATTSRRPEPGPENTAADVADERYTGAQNSPMNARVLALVALAVPLLGCGAPVASSNAETPWLHVRIEEPGKRSRVHLNLPMPAVEAALKAAPDSIAVDGGIPLGGDMNLDRFRRLWKGLETTGDAEIIKVEQGDAHQNVSKKDGRLLIHMRNDRESKTVDMDVPGAVVDALFSGAGQELKIRAAVAHLRAVRGDVVCAYERDASVRIWIDESAGAPEGN